MECNSLRGAFDAGDSEDTSKSTDLSHGKKICLIFEKLSLELLRKLFYTN